MKCNKYCLQKNANIDIFNSYREFRNRRKWLKTFIQVLNANEVCYSLVCSSSLFFKGIVDEFHDFDILINVADAEKAKKAFESIGGNIEPPDYIDECQSLVFMEFTFPDGIEVDVIGGFQIFTYGSSYLYELKKEDIVFINWEDYEIPCLSAEIEYILYSMMEGWQSARILKRKLIEMYLLENGFSSSLFIRELENHSDLPYDIIVRLKMFILA